MYKVFPLSTSIQQGLNWMSEEYQLKVVLIQIHWSTRQNSKRRFQTLDGY
jgi:hypothetical protein